MIITRTPFRISFAGGGSDLEAFYTEEPGVVLSTAIDKYMYLTVMNRFGSDFRISYSRTEIVNSIDEIQHDIVRESLRSMGIKKGLEIVSMANIPAQTGLGSSSAFTVGLLHALHAFSGQSVSPEQLAREACAMEITKLGEPIGKQDQYIAAYGGMQFIQFNPDGSVVVEPVVCSTETLTALNSRLMLFFTGVTRRAGDLLKHQSAVTEQKRDTLRKMCDLARQLRDVLVSGENLDSFGRLLHEAWEAKRSINASGISSASIDEHYDRALGAGALGGKLLGAGGGGFLLFYCEPELQEHVRTALSGLVEVPFNFERQGTQVIYLSDEGPAPEFPR